MKLPYTLTCLSLAALLLTSRSASADPGAGDPPEISTTSTHIKITLPPDWPHPAPPPRPPTPPASPAR